MSKSDNTDNRVDFVEECQLATAQQPLSATPIIPAAILGSTALMVVFLVIWMALTDIDLRTTGVAVAKPDTATRVVQNINGGRIKEIIAKPGDTVKIEQPLLRLDDTQYRSQYDAQLVRRAALQGQVARLNAQIQRQNTLEFPEGLADSYPEVVKTELALFNAEKQRLDSSINNQEKRKAAAQKELEMMVPLVKKEVLAKIEQTKMEVKIAEIEGEINSLVNDALAKASKDLNKKSSELQELNASIKSLEDKIHHAEVKSPINGVIIERKVHTIGEVVKPDTTMFTISPSGGKLLFKVEIVPEQIGFVHVGQTAFIQVKAFDYVIYGQLEGKVQRISHDTVLNTDNKRVYRADVVLDEAKLHYEGRTLNIKPGMTATVHIVTNRTSMLNYVLKPFIKTFKEAVGQR